MAFPRNIYFFIDIICIKFFWRILNLLSWNLNTFTKCKEQVSFTCCFAIILFYPFHLFIIFHCKLTHKMSQFSFWLLFCNPSVITRSTFCTWTGSLKWTPLPCQFSVWSINFLLKISLISAEITTSNLSKAWYQNKLPECFSLEKFLFSAG